jgi:hypothetical protein
VPRGVGEKKNQYLKGSIIKELKKISTTGENKLIMLSK